MDYISIKKELYSLTEEKYRKFSISLIPDHRNFIGVRIPLIRKIAKEIAKENPVEFLRLAKDDSFEEIMLQGFVICEIKDFNLVLKLCENHIPKIYNWSLCDSFVSSLKIFKYHKNEVFLFIKPYLKSENTYDVRFALVCLLSYFVDEEYLLRLFSVFDSITNDDYYVKMALAWAVSVCFVKYSEETITYLKTCHLSDDVFNMALKKIRESKRVDEKTKLIIKAMKR